MKGNGFHASTAGGKKVIAVSLVIALVLASISIIGAFAAPTSKDSPSAFGNQLRELNFDRAWFNSARSDATNFVRTSDPTRAQQYLAQYAFALNQADAIVAGRGTNTANNNNNNNGNSSSNNTNNTNFGSPKGDLAGWLHTMRGLQGKLADIGFNANISPSNVAGSGVPVTGGTSS